MKLFILAMLISFASVSTGNNYASNTATLLYKAECQDDFGCSPGQECLRICYSSLTTNVMYGCVHKCEAVQRRQQRYNNNRCESDYTCGSHQRCSTDGLCVCQSDYTWSGRNCVVTTAVFQQPCNELNCQTELSRNLRDVCRNNRECSGGMCLLGSCRSGGNGNRHNAENCRLNTDCPHGQMCLTGFVCGYRRPDIV